MRTFCLYSLFAVLILFTYSCSEDDASFDTLPLGPDKANYQSSTDVIDGMLRFNSLEEFDATLEELFRMNQDDLNAWGQTIEGFVSMQSIYEKALLEEASFPDRNSDIEQTHSISTYSAKGSLIFARDGSFFPNVPVPEMAYLVNREGKVKVGDDIIQYGYDEVNITYRAGSHNEYSRTTKVTHENVSPNNTTARVDGNSEVVEEYGASRTYRIVGKVEVIGYNVPIEDDDEDCRYYDCDPIYQDNYKSLYIVRLKNQNCSVNFPIAGCVWVAQAADVLTINSSFRVDGVLKGPFTVSGSNTKEVSRTLYSQYGLSSPKDFTNASNEFSVSNKGISDDASIVF